MQTFKFCLCPMFISFNSIGIYLFRVFSILVNMGRKRGRAKRQTNFWSFSVHFYFNALKLQNRSLSENIFFLKSRLDWTQTIYENCEIIINRWSLILGHFVVHLNHKKFKFNEIQFSHLLLPVAFGTTNSRTHGSMHFVETTKLLPTTKIFSR